MLVTGAVGAVIGGIGGAIYSQVKYGEVRWQNVAAGAAIGGVVGLTGGAATGAIFAGSATASTGAVLTGMGIAGAGAAGGGGALAAKQITDAISRVSSQSVNHIMDVKHAWDRVVSNVNWSSVQGVIQNTIQKGTSTIINSTSNGGVVYEAIQKVNSQTVVVRYAIIDGVIKISDAWVKTK
jgi:hypothetical protein